MRKGPSPFHVLDDEPDGGLLTARGGQSVEGCKMVDASDACSSTICLFLVAAEIHLCCFGSAVDSQRAPPSWVLFSSPDAVDLNMSEWATMSVVSRWPDKSGTIVP